MNLYCEKCGSGNVYEKIVDNRDKEVERTSIADYTGHPNVMTLEYSPTTYEIGCKNCGNSKTFSK